MSSWACLIEWITEQTGIALTRHAQRLLNEEFNVGDAAFKSAARADLTMGSA
jgi:hypothetical protein